MASIILPEISLLVLLTIASIIAIVVKKYIRVPYTVALIVFGMVIGLFEHTQIEFTKDLIFFFFLPPLLFEGAIKFNMDSLKENLVTIGSLAFFGLIITATIIGAAINYFLGIPLIYALLFGVIISPTDPISVLALFKKLNVGKRLSMIVEGESIFNDGVGIVLFTLVLGLIGTGSFSLVETAVDFVKVAFGGLLVGTVLGYFAYQLLRSIDDHVIEVLITLIVAYAAFIIAEHTMHLSGVMAVVAAGLLIGNTGKQFAMSPSTRLSINNFWEIIAFVINSLIFILIGINLPTLLLIKFYYVILIAIAAVLVARSISVYAVLNFLRLFKQKIQGKWQHIINWGGLHGSIPIALILGLPAVQYKDEISVMVYGVVFFSLVIQAMTMKPLIKKLGIATIDLQEDEFERLMAKRIALKKLLQETRSLHSAGRIGSDKKKMFDDDIRARLAEVKTGIDRITSKEMLIENRVKEARRHLLLYEKNVYVELLEEGSLSEDNAEQLISKLDIRLDELD